ncbi:uncharacterized protein LOC115688347 [Syzygium oleosum]|uniref:uncharacterized protein LOC115688347 n=1 Tax=Syzygium oleosum TaxID=219896 RepID=UPI0011D1C287|nr:uncharacterized protein LOC115688347 [Syzygium oleosum]XP_030470008.1 uncharacterized protein LOC115688347 [Syzygium oleosum]
MLEKIGLPARPSLRGSNWVVDASHCQGCSSQFTFINRKHHCRRCGGLFCNGCTLQRMVLRGQGDSPVRICDPCKKLEEAARFELRHGHRSKAGKGSSRVTSKNDDEVLAQLFAGDAKGSSSGADSDANTVSGIERTISGASSFDSQEYVDIDSLRETGSATPEELRQQSVDEKKKYKILKGEGKPEEALKAFKRGKELERQADALEIALRKSRRKVLPAEKRISAEPGREKKPQVGKDKGKDDLLSELRELGWSETDLHNEDKKPTSTVEGELSALIGELPQKPNDGKTKQGIDKSQITAHKRKALLLKREGKLAEAKEELKKAKVLEKQVEEQELLAEAEDSDDELSALVRSMDDDKQENLPRQKQHNFRLDDLIGVAGNLDEDSNFEVTDEDMADPKMAATLKSLGWAEDYDTELATQSIPFDRGTLSAENPSKIKAFGHKQDWNASTLVNESFVTQGIRSSLDGAPRRSKAEVQRELLGVKRKALALRREGKNEEAEEVLKMAKTLEAQISEMEASKNKFNTEHAKLENNKVKTSIESSVNAEHEEDVTESDLLDPSLLSMLEDLGWKDEAPEPAKVQEVASKRITDGTLQSVTESTIESSSVVSTSAPRTKAKIQRELLGLKRRALDLRRKGKLEEAEETLRMAKALEMEIEELELPKGPQLGASEKWNPESSSSSIGHEEHGNLDNSVRVSEGSTQEAVSLNVGLMNLERTRTNRADTSPEKSYFWRPEASEYDDELIGSQNFAQGDLTAKGAASSSKVVDSVDMMDLLTGSDWRNSQVLAEKLEDRPCSVSQSSHDIPLIQPGVLRSAHEDRTSKDEALMERKETHANKRSQVNETNVGEELHQKGQVSIQQEILIHKKKAVALKREGKLAEAKEELKQAKQLEKSLEEDKPQPSMSISSSTIPPMELKEEDTSKVTPKPLSSRERFKIQQESLRHKRQALKLRKEGRITDAEAELDLAKTLEAQLEESASHDSGKSSEDGVDDVVIEDLLDPELLSALKAIGIDDSSMVSRGPKKPEPVKHNPQSIENSGQDSIRLEEQIKAEKVKAVNLKRAGKQAEALDALRRAKMLEKKLNAS